MEKHKDNNPGPCKEKNCSRCCNPIKIPFKKGMDISNFPLPKDGKGNNLWLPLEEIWIPEVHIDTIRIQIYTCLLYDKDYGICKDYDNRPDICRTTSCIDINRLETIDNQYKKEIQANFIKIKK